MVVRLLSACSDKRSWRSTCKVTKRKLNKPKATSTKAPATQVRCLKRRSSTLMLRNSVIEAAPNIKAVDANQDQRACAAAFAKSKR